MSIISSQLLSFDVVTYQPRYRIWICFALKLVGGGKSHNKKSVASLTRPANLTSIILTYLITYLLTYLLTHSLTHLLTYLLTYLPTYVLTYLLTYLLTYSTVQSPSWEANWFAASQENPRISRNPKVHYRTHKRPPPVSILGQPNPVHIPTSHLLEIHPNIIHPSTPRSPQWSLTLRFPHQDPIHPPLLTQYTSIIAF